MQGSLVAAGMPCVQQVVVRFKETYVSFAVLRAQCNLNCANWLVTSKKCIVEGVEGVGGDDSRPEKSAQHRGQSLGHSLTPMNPLGADGCRRGTAGVVGGCFSAHVDTRTDLEQGARQNRTERKIQYFFY